MLPTQAMTPAQVAGQQISLASQQSFLIQNQFGQQILSVSDIMCLMSTPRGDGGGGGAPPKNGVSPGNKKKNPNKSF